MKTNYTLWERIRSDTPQLFRRAQVFGLGLATLGSSLAQVNGIPSNITTALISAGTAITLIAQFAVKQSEPLPKGGEDVTQ